MSSYPGTVRASLHPMKFLKLYLVGYFLLLVGAVLALWQAGVLKEIPGVWLAIAAIVAIGFGIMLAVASTPRVTTTTRDIR
jgi:small basic protein